MTDPEGQAGDKPLIGIAYIMGAMLMLTSLDAIAKHLVGTMPVMQMLASRGLVMVLILLSALPFLGGLQVLRVQDGWAQMRRAGYNIAAAFLFFSAIRELPLADLTVLVFGGSFIMTALSGPVLGEKVGLFRWSAVFIGFIGVVIAADPRGENLGLATLFAVAASLAYALLVIETRRMSRTETTFAITFYSALGGFLATALAAPAVWQPMELSAWPWLILMALFALTGHVFLARTYVYAPVGTAAPFEYTALIWATLFGYVFFDELPDNNVWLGAAIIISAGIFIILREARLSRSLQPTQPTIGD